jgi:FAD-dependent oxidoreductase domain-containing protein 1
MDRGQSVVIVGGGIIGCLTAWFLRAQGHSGPITIIERDPSYRFSSTALSAASIRVQFGCAVNVELSLFGGDFLRDVKSRLGDDANVGLVEAGYLILGSASSLADRLRDLFMQRQLGAKVEALTPSDLALRFPWLAMDDVVMATLGSVGEGWFDAWALLQAARKSCIQHGVDVVQAEVSGFATSDDRITAVVLADGASLPADWCVNAAGALSGQVALWAGIDLPVVPRKRTVFHFKAPLVATGMPMLFDISGAWTRPEGDGFIGGIQPDPDSDADAYGDFEPDHDLFEARLWPLLAARVPRFEQLRLQRAWAGHYEMNLLDHNGVVGPHPRIANFFLASGFSGHGVMHAPGVARGVAEHIVSGTYQTIDLAPLGYERIAAGRPLTESAIY